MVYNVLHSVSFPPQLPDFHDFQKKNGGPPARRVRWVLSGFSNQKIGGRLVSLGLRDRRGSTATMMTGVGLGRAASM